MSSSVELVSFLLSRGFPLSRDHLNDLVEWLVENEVESPSDLVQLGSVSTMVDAHLQFVLLLNWLQAVVDDVSVNGLDMAPVPTVASEPVVKKARIAEVFSAPHVPECASSSLPVSTGVVADFLNLADAPSTILNITGQGPNAAICTFRDALPASAFFFTQRPTSKGGRLRLYIYSFFTTTNGSKRSSNCNLFVIYSFMFHVESQFRIYCNKTRLCEVGRPPGPMPPR
jgi:hypothetical protein